MKKIFLASIAALSFNAFSQSYMILENGVTITTDKAGYVYDFGHHAYPEKVTLKGGQYFVEENSILATIDENGLLFRKYEVIPEKIIGKGINYFMSSEGDLFTVDKKGIVLKVTEEVFKRAVSFGGNYFAVMNDDEKKMADIYTVDENGKYKVVLPSYKLTDIAALGGNYFMTNKGVLHTITHEGNVVPWPLMRVGVLVKRGGNYFTDSTGMIYTVAADGTLQVPTLPVSLQLTSVIKRGSNYFLDITGRLFVVDRDGAVYDRTLDNYDFKQARIISL